MAEFIYQAEGTEFDEETGLDVPVGAQVEVLFQGEESAMDWLEWLKHHGFAQPTMRLVFDIESTSGIVQDRFYTVMVPDRERMILHRLTWGGKIA